MTGNIACLGRVGLVIHVIEDLVYLPDRWRKGKYQAHQELECAALHGVLDVSIKILYNRWLFAIRRCYR
jgi:hypothetical protein